MDANLRQIESLAVKNRKMWSDYWASILAIDKNYDTRVLIIPEGTADRIKKAWSLLSKLLKSVSRGDGGLLKHSSELNLFLRQTSLMG